MKASLRYRARHRAWRWPFWLLTAVLAVLGFICGAAFLLFSVLVFYIFWLWMPLLGILWASALLLIVPIALLGRYGNSLDYGEAR